MAAQFHGVWGMVLHSVTTLPFWFLLSGIITAWYFYMVNTKLPGKITQIFRPFYNLLDRKYYIDELYSWLFAGGARALGQGLWKFGEVKIIDGFFVNGAARVVVWASMLVRRFQSGYIYHYAFTMIVGVFVLIILWLYRA